LSRKHSSCVPSPPCLESMIHVYRVHLV